MQWWNGVPSALSVIDPSHWGVATAAAVEGRTPYVAGWTNDFQYYPIPAYWKSGVRKDLSVRGPLGGEASSIAVSGGSVYVGGRVAYEYGRFLPSLWKDGARTELHEPGSTTGVPPRGQGYSGEVRAVAVADGRVFCAGSQSPPEGGAEGPALWVNGELRDLAIPEAATGGAVTDIAVRGAELVLVGYARLGDEGERPLLWHGEAPVSLRLPEGAAGARATSVVIARGLVLVAGWASMGGEIDLPVFWEDGVPILCELPAGYVSGRANDAFELGASVYMPGWVEGRDGSRRAAYWKDGMLATLARMEGELRSQVIGSSWALD